MRLRLLFILFIFAQAVNGNDIKISLLTCTPGDELYSTYGHSAILVEQLAIGKKTVYNYGTFDFNTPNFGVKFIMGDLLYKLSPEKYSDFVNEYKYQGRGIIEQEMDLTDSQKEIVLAFLTNNLKPANSTYLYDFFFDNCSTRIRDLLEQELNITYPVLEQKPKTFRELLKPYLTDTPWYHFGTNLILGKPTDTKADFRAEMFLPDYLSVNLGQAKLGNQLLLKPATELLPKTVAMTAARFNMPLFTMIGILLLSLVVSAFSNRFWQTGFDTILFSAAILSGFLFTFMWVFTQHEVCHQNFNLLWGNPLMLILLIFAALSKKSVWKWFVFYLIGVVFIWYLLPQKMPLPMLFFTLAMLVRASHRAKYLFQK